ESTRQAHATYCLQLSEQAELELGGPQQTAWLEQLEREHDNLRAALQWTVEQRETQHSMEMALRLGGALRLFWWGHGHWSEGRSFLERALAGGASFADPRIDPSVRAKALLAAANLAFVQSDYERTKVLSEESL